MRESSGEPYGAPAARAEPDIAVVGRHPGFLKDIQPVFTLDFCHAGLPIVANPAPPTAAA